MCQLQMIDCTQINREQQMITDTALPQNTQLYFRSGIRNSLILERRRDKDFSLRQVDQLPMYSDSLIRSSDHGILQQIICPKHMFRDRAVVYIAQTVISHHNASISFADAVSAHVV
jgi:hypothetical protein